MIVNDILRHTLSGTLFGLDTWNLVSHYRCITGAETDYAAINVAIGVALTAAYAGIEATISDDVVSTTMDLWEWDFTANEFDGKAQGASTALVGTSVAEMSPNGISAVIRFATAELRRQARKFIPGLTESAILHNGLTAGLIAALVTSAALLNDDIITGGATIRPCTFNSTPLSPRFETSSDFSQTAFVNTLVGYQRRRQPGAGT